MGQKWYLVDEISGETDEPDVLATQVIRHANRDSIIEFDLSGTEREGGRMILLPSGKIFIIDPPDKFRP